MIDSMREQLVIHEGLRLKPYKCTAGKLTIGIGRNIEDNGISMEEAYMMLDNDIARVESELIARFPWFCDLTPIRQGVVIDMVFNLGISRFLKFKKTIAAIGSGNYKTAAKEMLDSDWAKQVGNRAMTLAKQMETG